MQINKQTFTPNEYRMQKFATLMKISTANEKHIYRPGSVFFFCVANIMRIIFIPKFSGSASFLIPIDQNIYFSSQKMNESFVQTVVYLVTKYYGRRAQKKMG